MKSNSNVLTGLLIVAVAVAGGVGYLSLQKSGALTNGESNAEASISQTFPPMLFLDSKVSTQQGCYDLRWSSVNVTSCTASWRPTIANSGTERVCLGKISDGARIVGPKIGEITQTITCSGPTGDVSRTVKMK